MKGIIRRLDELARIMVPCEWMYWLAIKPESLVKITLLESENKEVIMIEKIVSKHLVEDLIRYMELHYQSKGSNSLNSILKGKPWEQELVKIIKSFGYDVHRSVQYNGKALDSTADLVRMKEIYMECKSVENLNIYDAVDQVKRDAKESEIPTVFSSKK